MTGLATALLEPVNETAWTFSRTIGVVVVVVATVVVVVAVVRVAVVLSCCGGSGC